MSENSSESSGKLCPLLTNFSMDVQVICGEDGSAYKSGMLGKKAYPCIGWKNGKCAFMHE